MSTRKRTGLVIAVVVAVVVAAAIPVSCAVAHGETTHAESPVPKQPAERVSVPAIDAASFWALSGVDENEAVDAILARMGPEERLGQLFMLSYAGDQPTPLLYAWIQRRGLGGVKIFGWNTDDTDRLASAITSIQKAAQGGPLAVPPFIATDQEGGWIRHVRGATSVTPGNMAIGASAWPSDAYQSAYYIGVELTALGITMNFAPAVDLATRPESEIIGPRAFSADPTQTGILAAAWVRGMSDAGVLATAKHYPGHGDTTLDSHGILPIIRIDEETLWNRELVPYRMLAAEGVPGIMSGHLAFPRIDGSNEPASLSRHMIQEILRDRIGYDGLVITDDLLMTGAASSGGLADTCERAIRAGNDILMFSCTLAMDDQVWNHMYALYRDDAAFRARVDQSARRVIRAKLRWLLPRGRDGIMPSTNPGSSMRSEQSQEFFAQQALRSATVLGQLRLPMPVTGRVLVAGQFGDYFTEATARFPASDTYRFSYLPADRASESELAGFVSRMARADTVVVCVANQASAEFAKAAVRAGKRLYVVSALNPTYSLEFEKTATVVAVYAYARESFRAAFAVLAGDIDATGRLPIVERP